MLITDVEQSFLDEYRLKIPQLEGEKDHHYLMFLQWVKDEGNTGNVRRLHKQLTNGKDYSVLQVYRLQKRNLWSERVSDLERVLADKLQRLAEDNQKTLEPTLEKVRETNVRRVKETPLRESGLEGRNEREVEPAGQVSQMTADDLLEDIQDTIIQTREARKKNRITFLSEAQEKTNELIHGIFSIHAKKEVIKDMPTKEALKLLPSLMAAQLSLQKAEREEYGEIAADEKVDVEIVIKTLAIQLNLSPAEEDEFKMMIFKTHREIQQQGQQQKVIQSRNGQDLLAPTRNESDEEIRELMGVSEGDFE